MNTQAKIQKFADTVDDMKPYQQRVVRRIQSPSQPGLVVAHGVGSGKTRTSIEAYKQLGLPTNVIVPAALQANYAKELEKWVGEDRGDLDIMSQQALARQGMASVDKPGGLMIVDEAHRARELDSQLNQELALSQAKKKLFLTGTPIFNHPKDLAALVNLAAGKHVLPASKSGFEERYIKNNVVNPSIVQRAMGVKPGYDPSIINRDELKDVLDKYVDYYPGQAQGYPSSRDETIKVPMSGGQTDIYKTIMGKAPLWVRWKVKAGLPPGKNEFAAMRAFLNGARQVSNTSAGFIRNPRREESAKIEKAISFFKQKLQTNPRYKAVIYSNYINSGLNPYKRRLDRAGIPYGEFSGDIDQKVRNDMVKQYNADKLKALLISSAGSEGLDLKGTRLVQILEPHFNEEKEKQIVGRAIRYKSHAALPADQQNVLIQRYMAQPRGGFFDRLLGKENVRGTDEYIRDMAQKKSLLTNEVIKLLGRQRL